MARIQPQKEPKPDCARNADGCRREPLRPPKLPHLHRLVLPRVTRPHHITDDARWDEKQEVEIDLSKEPVTVRQDRVGEAVVEADKVAFAATNRDQTNAQDAGKGDRGVEDARCQIRAQGPPSNHEESQPCAVEFATLRSFGCHGLSFVMANVKVTALRGFIAPVRVE